MIMNVCLKKIISNIENNKDKGQVTLFIAVSMTVFMLYVGLFTINRSINEQKSLTNSANSVGSFYAADVGTERFLLELNERIVAADFISLEDTIIAAGIDAEISLGDGRSFRVSLPGPSQVKIVGNYKNVDRAIELNYAP